MSESRLSERLQQPYRLRQLIAKYGEKIGRRMYNQEQLSEELKLEERIEEIDEASENLEWRKQQIEELKQMLLTEMEEYAEVLQLLSKAKDDPDVRSMAILFERDRTNKDMWHAKYVYQSFSSKVKNMLAGERIIRFTKPDGSTELLRVNMHSDTRKPRKEKKSQ